MSSPDDHQLETWLRQSKPAPIADNGFTATVLNRLPPPVRSKSPTWTRIAAIILGAVAGIIVVWNHAVDSRQLQTSAIELAADITQPQVMLAAAAIAATLVGVFAPEIRRRLSRFI